MKNKYSDVIIAVAAAFCTICAMTSCNDNNSNSKTTVVNDVSKTETTKEASVSSAAIPEFDDNGSKITSIVVTDAEKQTVTNQAGLPVTELAVLDKENHVVTKANGSPVPPSLESIEKKTQQTQADFSNPDAPANYKGFSSFLWMAQLNNGNKFVQLSGDTSIVSVKVKIKDNAPSGNYKLILNPNASSFCDETKDIPFTYESPVISIGDSEAPEAFDPSSTSSPVLCSTNASAQPGEEVTLTFSISNNPGIIAFNVSFNYDNSVMSVQSIDVSEPLSKGEFQTNIK